MGQVEGSAGPVVVDLTRGGTGAGGSDFNVGGRSGAAFFGIAVAGAALIDSADVGFSIVGFVVAEEGVGGGDKFGVSGTAASSEEAPFGKK